MYCLNLVRIGSEKRLYGVLKLNLSHFVTTSTSMIQPSTCECGFWRIQVLMTIQLLLKFDLDWIRNGGSCITAIYRYYYWWILIGFQYELSMYSKTMLGFHFTQTNLREKTNNISFLSKPPTTPETYIQQNSAHFGFCSHLKTDK